MSQPEYSVLDTFTGVNKSATETLLKLGEASEMSNWIITDDMKIQKQYGYERLNNPTGTKINGIWNGMLEGVPHLLFARGGKVYEHQFKWDGDIDVELGKIADGYPTTFFVTNNTVYIMDGTEMYSWDGDTFKKVDGYVPTVFTAAPPTGGGTMLEGMNYLTGKKSMKFSGDGTATVFQLPEYNIQSIDSVMVGVELKVKGTDYTVDLVNGTITFVTAPPNGVNNVVPTWTKQEPGYRERITKCRYYGGQYYARFWIYGNPDNKNTRFCSGVTMAGASDPTYWPIYTDSDVGEYEITAINTQYDKQLIWTTGDSSGASAWYSTNENYTDPYTGIITTLFQVFPFNANVGNMVPGQVQIILNNPFTI